MSTRFPSPSWSTTVPVRPEVDFQRMTLSTTVSVIVPLSAPAVQASEPSSRILSVPLTVPRGVLTKLSHSPAMLLRSWICALGGSSGAGGAAAQLAMHTPRRPTVRLSPILDPIGVFMAPLYPSFLSGLLGNSKRHDPLDGRTVQQSLAMKRSPSRAPRPVHRQPEPPHPGKLPRGNKKSQSYGVITPPHRIGGHRPV